MGWDFENSKSKLERFLQQVMLGWNYYISQQSPLTRDFELNPRSVSFNPRFQKFIHSSAQTQISWGGSSSRSSISSSSLSSNALIRAHLAIPQLQGTGCSSVAGSSSWINQNCFQRIYHDWYRFDAPQAKENTAGGWLHSAPCQAASQQPKRAWKLTKCCLANLILLQGLTTIAK